MYTKVMIALYRYRIAVSSGEDKVNALVRSCESVADSFFEYADIYKMALSMI